MLTGADLEGEEDEGEELSLVTRPDEECIEGVLEVDLGFVFVTAAVWGVNACKNNISVSDFAFN